MVNRKGVGAGGAEAFGTISAKRPEAFGSYMFKMHTVKNLVG